MPFDETAAHRQHRRREALNRVAEDIGYSYWSEFETDLINDRVRVIVKSTPPDERKPWIRPSPYLHLPRRKPMDCQR